jgi:MurNAc alpha-1-phosphate uridylyltransferase
MDIQAMILAAGHGRRMRPLTDSLPKPLLEVRGKPLIVHQIERLRAAGITDLVINHARLGKMIEAVLGDGVELGVDIRYSSEGEEPLETAGGIVNAMALLESDPFILVNADIFCEYPLQHLPRLIDTLAHLVLVPNPPHHTEGDFAIKAGLAQLRGEPSYTYSGIGVFQKALFADLIPGEFATLGPLLKEASASGRVSAELFTGFWSDIGTPERLAALNAGI